MPLSSELADGKTVTINKINDAVDGATIQAHEIDGGEGLNIMANFAATVKTGYITNIAVNGKTYKANAETLEIKTTDGGTTLYNGEILLENGKTEFGVTFTGNSEIFLTVTNGELSSIKNFNDGDKIEYNGKTYTVTGYYIYDGEKYYSNKGNADLLNLETRAVTNIPVTDGVINFPAEIADNTVFVGENGELVAIYEYSTLYIKGIGNYTVKKTSSDIIIYTGDKRTYKPSGEIEIAVNSSSSNLSKGTVQLSTTSETEKIYLC